MSSVADIQASEWGSAVESMDKPVVVEYWHHKCPICVEMKPVFDAQTAKHGDSVYFKRMNLLETKENRVFAIRNGVRSTPTFIVYCLGRPIGQIIGKRSIDEFSSELELILENVDSCLEGTPVEE